MGYKKGKLSGSELKEVWKKFVSEFDILILIGPCLLLS